MGLVYRLSLRVTTFYSLQCILLDALFFAWFSSLGNSILLMMDYTPRCTRRMDSDHVRWSPDVNTYPIAFSFHSLCTVSTGSASTRLNVDMRLSTAFAILLTTVIAASKLRTPDLPPVNPLLDSEQSPLLRHPPPPEPEQLGDNLHDSSVSMHTYDELERFAKYSSAVYQFLCPRPLGNSLVQSFSNVLTHTHGFVVRDDRRREIVVAFRGSHELANMVTDGNLVLIPLVSRGIEENNTALVHAGFLISYNSVRAVVVHVVRNQLLAFPNYTVVISGSHPLYSVPASCDSCPG